jgi:hypothetical protein
MAMRTLRPAIASSPLNFGRRGVALSPDDAESREGDGADLRLFATSFAVGFLFVSVLIF